MNQPTFELPNFETTTQGNFSTATQNRFIVGFVTLNDGESLRLAIDGGDFSADTDFILHDEETGRFIIPNPNVYQDGYVLTQGANKFEVRVYDSNNLFGASSSLIVRLVDESVVTILPEPPTGVRAESYDGFVCIKWTNVGLDTDNIQGYNVYCSTRTGGTGGYFRINLISVDTPIMERTLTDFATLDADVSIATDIEGNPAADPLFAELTMTQKGLDGVVIRTDVNELLEIPETVGALQVGVNISTYDTKEYYSFDHYRGYGPRNIPPTIANSSFVTTPEDVDLYYTVAALYIDPVSGVEIESPLSVEVAVHPTKIRPSQGEFPQVGREALLQSTVNTIYQVNPEIAIQPGSVIRDVILDPFLNEAARLRLIMDFMHRATSLTSLLAIDDPNGSGTSIDASVSPYKTALQRAFFLLQPYEVQQIIDQCFDKLASNFGITRLQGQRARGEATFFVRSRPTSSIVIPLGTSLLGGGFAFRTTASATISIENLATFYDPANRRYSVTLPIVADTAGVGGNVSPGGITRTEIQDVSVTNSAPCFGGTDQETNTQLALRTQNAIASVDTGTLRGYLKVASSVPGVEEAQVVSADDSFMLRDYHPTNGSKVGGCVDVWIRGVQAATVTDTFAFTYEVRQDVQFILADSPSALMFRALDENLSELNPLMEMLDVENPKMGLRNISTGEYFDLTNVEILSPNLIRLDTTIDQPSVDYGDVILGDYRYRTGTEFVLTRQPVGYLVSVSGTVVGQLDSSLYTLNRPSSPFMLGYSSKADESLIVKSGTTYSEDAPTGERIDVTDESHIIVGEFIEYVNNLGAVGLTLTVTSADGLITYKGPYDPSGEMDYTIQEGTQTIPLGIKRVVGGNIEDGQEVLISYTHDENFVVEYTTNIIVSTVQSEIDNQKHLTANVLVKEAVPIFVNITATVLVQRGNSSSFVDDQIRTNLQNLFLNLRMGEPIRQSDIIEVIDSTEGVSYVIVPLTEMAFLDGAHIIREELTSDQISDFEHITTWSNQHNNVFLLKESFNHRTSDGGGIEFGNYRAVFKNNDEMEIIDDLPYLLAQKDCQAYIIGNEGLPIPGVSDDLTLQALGYVEEADIQAKRQELTQNRVLISLAVGDTPRNYDWAITYTSIGDDGANDLEISGISYLRLGAVTLSFDEDRPAISRSRTSQSNVRY